MSSARSRSLQRRPRPELCWTSPRDAGRLLVETRNLLYNDVVLGFDRALADGRVGDIREVDVSLALDLNGADVPRAGGLGLPGGIAHDYLPHLAYLLPFRRDTRAT